LTIDDGDGFVIDLGNRPRRGSWLSIPASALRSREGTFRHGTPNLFDVPITGSPREDSSPGVR
jgi:hypothetical protein